MQEDKQGCRCCRCSRGTVGSLRRRLHRRWPAVLLLASAQQGVEQATSRQCQLLQSSPLPTAERVRVYTEGSRALRKLVTAVSVRMQLKGAKISGMGVTWIREHLKWSLEQMRDYIVIYGGLCIFTAISITPRPHEPWPCLFPGWPTL